MTTLPENLRYALLFAGVDPNDVSEWTLEGDMHPVYYVRLKPSTVKVIIEIPGSDDVD